MTPLFLEISAEDTVSFFIQNMFIDFTERRRRRMLLFFTSHTHLFSHTRDTFKKIYNAVKCAIPTPNFKKKVFSGGNI